MKTLLQKSLKKILFPALFIALGTLSQGQSNYRLVNFGPQASVTEGDPFHYQVVLLKIPKSWRDSSYIRLFDADCGGANDQHYNDWNTSVSFALYGGDNAFSDEFETTEKPSDAVIDGGTLIKKESFEVNPFLDNEWYTFARLNPSQGYSTGDYLLYKLVVRAASGDDGNAYEVDISGSSAKSIVIPGALVYSYRPTLRLDKRGSDPVIRFPAGNNTSVDVYTYDLAEAPVSLESNVRKEISVQTSGDGQWSSTRTALNGFENGSDLGLIVGKGRELPNDASFYFRGSERKLLPVTLPVKAYAENARPEVKKTFNILSDCFTVVFDASQSSDKDRQELLYRWDFGDGDKAEGMRVRHTYKEKKSYTASVLISDNSGTVGNASYEVFQVPVNKEPIPAASFREVAAPGDEVSFSAQQSRDEDGTLSRAVWDFGRGNKKEGFQVVNKFDQPGKLPVTLTVFDNSLSPCNNSSVTREIWINAQPISIAGTDIWVSPGQEFMLDGSKSYDTDGDIKRYLWDMGDGSSREGKTIRHSYRSTGFFKVTLTVEDDAGVGNSKASSSLMVKVNTRPVAKIGRDLIVAPQESIVFDGKNCTDADGSISNYSWDFGDGNTSEGFSVSHFYKEPGTYRVKLIITDNAGTSSSTAEDAVTVKVNRQPTVSIGEDRLVTSSTVQFNGDGAKDADGRIALYEWKFGDGTSSNEKSPLHTYRSPGVYKVTLRVKDDNETTNNSAEASMRVVVNAKPIADAGKGQTGAPGQQLNFTAKASFDPDGSITSYAWDFGDNAAAKGRDVSHTYASPGIYKVRLKIEDNSGQAEAVDFAELTVVVNDKPTAIAGNDQIVLPDQQVTLDAGASFDRDGQIAKYRWQVFPTGQIFEEPVVKLTFKQYGVYFAALTVFDNSGAINAYSSDTVMIKVNSQPNANAGTNVYTCNSKVTFDASKSSDADGDPLNYTWDFGDGSATETGIRVVHTYKKGGTYPVVLRVEDGMKLSNSSSASSIKVVINEPPKADAGPDQVICAGETVRFDAAGSKDPEGGTLRYSWEFGDGTTGDGINPTKIYKKGGAYQIKLKVEDDSGLPCNTDYDTKVVVVSESPVADAGKDVTACANAVIQFDGTKSKNYDGVVNNYTWDFGDGTVGGGSTPTHGYPKAGIYRVVLSITGDVKGECDNTDTDELIVTVIDAPKADFTIPQNFPVGKPLQLSAIATTNEGINVTDYDWNFGDGTTGTGKSVEKVFAKYGEFYVTLTVKTDAKTDCHTTSVRKLIVVNEPPSAKFAAAPKTGLNQPVLFDASGSRDADGSLQTYEWSFGDGSSDAGINVWHRYPASGTYTYTLKVKDNTQLENNSSAVSGSIRVNSTPVPKISMPSAVCPRAKTDFDASGSTDSDGKIVEYLWDFGDGNTASGAKVEHTFALPGIYNISLTVDDGDSLSNSRNETVRQLQVNHRPEVKIGQVPVLCKGEPVVISPKKIFDADNDNLQYSWKISDGSRYTTKEIRHTFSKSGKYFLVLSVDDGKGTACSEIADTVEVIVNASPVANAGGDKTGFTGGAHDEVLFDASKSSDPDGDALQYIWEFGDGVKANGEKVYHQYEKAGTYKIVLTVSDNKGSNCSKAVDSAIITITGRNK